MKINDTGTKPGAEATPAMVDAYRSLVDGLERAGIDDALFVISLMLPSHSDRAGYDVVLTASNLPTPEDVQGFIAHLAGHTCSPDGHVRIVSMSRLRALVEAMLAPDNSKKH